MPKAGFKPADYSAKWQRPAIILFEYKCLNCLIDPAVPKFTVTRNVSEICLVCDGYHTAWYNILILLVLT
jgi:hypothetical protein